MLFPSLFPMFFSILDLLSQTKAIRTIQVHFAKQRYYSIRFKKTLEIIDVFQNSNKRYHNIDRWLKGGRYDISIQLMSIGSTRPKFNVHFENHG